MWLCKNCGEQIEDETFDRCWKCGTERPGTGQPDSLVDPLPPREPVHTCPNCRGFDLYRSEAVSSGGGYAPNFLPSLGGWFTSASFHLIVCRACGLTRFFASDSATEKLADSKHWTPLNPSYLDDLKDL